MNVHKAVITAAGASTWKLPFQTLVDRDGETKTALRILVEEATRSGVEEVVVVIGDDDPDDFRAASGLDAGRLRFVVQDAPRGYGHALHCTREVVGDEPFLHFLGDHIVISQEDRRCARQLLDVANEERTTVSAVQPTSEHLLPYFGVVGGRRERNRPRTYVVEHAAEKPTPTLAEQSLVVPGLRAGHYLCFFGMHVLTPPVYDVLDKQLAAAEDPTAVTLTSALDELARRERVLAYEVAGTRHDLGARYGLLVAQTALALSGSDREQVLTELLELLAQQARAATGP